jgi:hypothetical protein
MFPSRYTKPLSYIIVFHDSVSKLLPHQIIYVPSSQLAENQKKPCFLSSILFKSFYCGFISKPQSTYRGRVGIWKVCILPLSWSVQHNFVRDGRCSERGWECTPRPHQPGLIFPSRWNLRKKVAVATLCTLCSMLCLFLCFRTFEEPRNRFPAWRACMETLFDVPARLTTWAGGIVSLKSIPGLLKRLQIRAQVPLIVFHLL